MMILDTSRCRFRNVLIIEKGIKEGKKICFLSYLKGGMKTKHIMVIFRNFPIRLILLKTDSADFKDLGFVAKINTEMLYPEIHW